MKDNFFKLSNYLENKFIVFSLIFIIGFLLFFNSLNNDFVYDDLEFIKNNSGIKEIKNLKFLFSKVYYEISKELSYRPIATFSYIVLYYFFKLTPTGYHFVSIVLHITCSFLIFLILKELGFSSLINFFSTLLFLAHPVVTEAVNCIAFNEELFCALFYFASFYFYIKTKKQSKKLLLYYIFSFLFYSLSLFSKEMALSFPLILLGYEVIIAKKELLNISKKDIFYYVTIFFMSLFFIFIRNIIIPSLDTLPVVKELYPNLYLRIIFIPFVFLKFIKSVLFPFFLNADYNFFYPSSIFSPVSILSFVFFILYFLIFFYFYKKNPLVSFGLFFFFFSLFPVYNIIPIANPIADRYLYLPLFGFVLISASFLKIVFESFFIKDKIFIKSTYALIYGLVIVISSVLTILRNNVWQSDFTLWTDVLKKNPYSFRANYNIAIVYSNNGNIEKAIEHYKIATEIDPKSYQAFNNLGILYLATKNFRSAINCFKKALELNNKHVNAYFNLALTYSLTNEKEKAIETFRKLIDFSPYDYEALFMLGKLLYETGNKNEAVVVLKKAVEIKDDFAEAKELLKKIR